MVLENAVVSTFSNQKTDAEFVSENVGQFRVAIKDQTREIIEKLTAAEGAPDELGYSISPVTSKQKRQGKN
jgi:hypothetical protein